MVRIWDSFLTDQDRRHIELHPAPRKGQGASPVLLLVDLHRAAFGDKPLPLLDAVKTWPASCGLAAWNALPSIQRLLGAARAAAVPVIHSTGTNVLNWRQHEPRGNQVDRRHLVGDERRYEIIDQVRPDANEPVIEKVAPSAFFGTPLLTHLIGLRADTIVVAGESTSGCVRATVVDGKSAGFQVAVVEECVFDRHESAHAMNLFDIDQKYGDVIALEEAIGYFGRVGSIGT